MQPNGATSVLRVLLPTPTTLIGISVQLRCRWRPVVTVPASRSPSTTGKRRRGRRRCHCCRSATDATAERAMAVPCLMQRSLFSLRWPSGRLRRCARRLQQGYTVRGRRRAPAAGAGRGICATAGGRGAARIAVFAMASSEGLSGGEEKAVGSARTRRTCHQHLAQSSAGVDRFRARNSSTV